MNQARACPAPTSNNEASQGLNPEVPTKIASK